MLTVCLVLNCVQINSFNPYNHVVRYHLHFRDENTEGQRDWVNCSKSCRYEMLEPECGLRWFDSGAHNLGHTIMTASPGGTGTPGNQHSLRAGIPSVGILPLILTQFQAHRRSLIHVCRLYPFALLGGGGVYILVRGKILSRLREKTI